MRPTESTSFLRSWDETLITQARPPKHGNRADHRLGVQRPGYPNRSAPGGAGAIRAKHHLLAHEVCAGITVAKLRRVGEGGKGIVAVENACRYLPRLTGGIGALVAEIIDLPNGTGSLFSRSTSKGWLTTKLNPCLPLACSSPIRVAALPLISSVRITACSGVALDGVGFSVDGKGALLRQPSNAAPTQAPPEARNERRECARAKALPSFSS